MKSLLQHLEKIKKPANITWQFCKTIGVPALVAILVSLAFQIRLENNKQQVAAVLQAKDHFESSQSELFMQIGLYTGHLMDGLSPPKDDLLKAITSAQLQSSNLKNELPPADQGVVEAYSEELSNLSSAIRHVSAPEDLKPVFVSAQKLLHLHDNVSDKVRDNLAIPMPWGS